ncbi:Hsp20/alpha crystallin family protein [Paraburkholderia sp. UYCP14C]|uniref:Hsp20/alpha crystallin family protein n=1 Tax=Paraburkholderia sp. UYCP14C TaxID=2511130 RepID=UPI0010210D79|nr:Hsp20/alpha crystallin family protein [Paraburkholderia sp. UYCP14C]RZF25703.1 Hsp20/alpha crystallin family protein [Paraburkholderia sp. UYCP14C]
MSEPTSKVPVKKSAESTERSWPLQSWHPMESLRREIDRLFDDFDGGFKMLPMRHSVFDIEPFWRRERALTSMPAVDVAETDKAYEITAELPGLEEKDIEVKLANGGLTIKGAKNEEKEEKKKDYYLHERRYGSFERYFDMPQGVDKDKIEAIFKKGVLTVTLPKTAEAQKAEKKIPVKAG